MKRLVDYPKSVVRMCINPRASNTLEYEISVPALVAQAADDVIDIARKVDAYLTSENISLEFDTDMHTGDLGDGLNLMLKELDALTKEAPDADASEAD